MHGEHFFLHLSYPSRRLVFLHCIRPPHHIFSLKELQLPYSYCDSEEGSMPQILQVNLEFLGLRLHQVRPSSPFHQMPSYQVPKPGALMLPHSMTLKSLQSIQPPPWSPEMKEVLFCFGRARHLETFLILELAFWLYHHISLFHPEHNTK